MIDLITELINSYTKSGSKTFEVNKLLETLELDIGGERFELMGGYRHFADCIDALFSDGKLLPVKSSGRNGMTPALYTKYRILNIEPHINEIYRNEILALHPVLKKDYYLNSMKDYESDREYVLRLNNYLQKSGFSGIMRFRCTMNERSFEIFNDEKLLDKRGKTILRRLGMGMEMLNCYRTYEAFFYIVLKPGMEGNALIIENKDTFMSLVRAMNSEDSVRYNINNINLLIYGEGNKITKSFEFMSELGRDNPVNKIFYYGDIDYPGIDIYQRLAKGFKDYSIVPHVKLYEQLIASADKPPEARNNMKTDIENFLGYFGSSTAVRISSILSNHRYIPQEGLIFAKGKFEI